MRSELRQLAVGLLVLLGCTEQLPIEPVTTSADDWTPTYRTTWYGYQSMVLAIDGPPRKELIPNIARYIVSIREIPGGDMVPIDTLTYVAPSYVSPNNHSTDSWKTDARIPYGKIYYTSLAVEYRNGTVRQRVGSSLVPDMGRGTIVQRHAIGTAPIGEYASFGDRLAVWRSQPIFTRADRAYLIDTTTGTFSLLTSLLPPPAPGQIAYEDQRRLRSIGVDGDTLIAIIQAEGDRRVMFCKVDLNTLAVDTSLSVLLDSLQALSPCTAATSGGRVGLIVGDFINGYRLLVYSSRSGGLLTTSSSSSLLHEGIDRLACDGTDFWISSWKMHEIPAAFYPIKRLDPMTLSYSVVHRNPIEHAGAFAIEPSYAWFVDHGANGLSVVRVRLEGF